MLSMPSLYLCDISKKCKFVWINSYFCFPHYSIGNRVTQTNSLLCCFAYCSQIVLKSKGDVKTLRQGQWTPWVSSNLTSVTLSRIFPSCSFWLWRTSWTELSLSNTLKGNLWNIKFLLMNLYHTYAYANKKHYTSP